MSGRIRRLLWIALWTGLNYGRKGHNDTVETGEFILDTLDASVHFPGPKVVADPHDFDNSRIVFERALDAAVDLPCLASSVVVRNLRLGQAMCDEHIQWLPKIVDHGLERGRELFVWCAHVGHDRRTLPTQSSGAA